jgi:hypothetical protein
MKNMNHCAIIGAGEIGSRHLQALSHLENPTRIDLVDPSNKSIKKALDRYEEVASSSEQNIELYCHNSLDDLPKILDLVIVATNSIVREKVIRDVVEKRSVKNLILEKILFQRAGQYIAVKKFLEESSIPTWVSCWMRTTALCKQIKSTLNLNNAIHVKVEGSQWRMGTSSIHFMDLFSYLTEYNDFKFTDIQLSNEITESRHRGYKEFSGQMVGQNSRGDTLNLICRGPENEPPTIEIVNSQNRYKIIGLVGKVVFESSNDLANRITETNLPYQSQLTHLWVDDILSRGTCDLPTYVESMPLHQELIRVLSKHFKKITGKGGDACPIT